MNILILNWRDVKNPSSGGAEILTHEIAKGFVRKGHKVTLFSSLFKNANNEEKIDGVDFIRKGTWWNVHLFAFFYYMTHKNDYNIVIDEVHWFPFFAKIYAPKKTVTLTCEVANRLFFTLFPNPVALLFRGLEKFYLFLYKNVLTLTISESTKKDLVKEGVKKEMITVLRLGINLPKNLPKYTKEKTPTFIYLARLNKQKGIFDAVRAFSLIKKSLPRSIFWIVGSGDDETILNLKELVKEKGLEDSIKFFGFVTEKKKYELLARAHLLVVPSVQEGWGLTVIEAASQATPSIGYNVEGLRDSIFDGKTGLLSKPNPQDLAKQALQLLHNKVQYKSFEKASKEWSKKFNWEESQKKSLEVLCKLSKTHNSLHTGINL